MDKIQLKYSQIVNVINNQSVEDDRKVVVHLIQIEPKSVIYYDGQPEPHLSYTWLTSEDWAAFHRNATFKNIVSKMFSGESMKFPTSFYLDAASTVFVDVKSSKVPLASLPATLVGLNLAEEDIVGVLETKIRYGHFRTEGTDANAVALNLEPSYSGAPKYSASHLEHSKSDKESHEHWTESRTRDNDKRSAEKKHRHSKKKNKDEKKSSQSREDSKSPSSKDESGSKRSIEPSRKKGKHNGSESPPNKKTKLESTEGETGSKDQKDSSNSSISDIDYLMEYIGTSKSENDPSKLLDENECHNSKVRTPEKRCTSSSKRSDDEAKSKRTSQEIKRSREKTSGNKEHSRPKKTSKSSKSSNDTSTSSTSEVEWLSDYIETSKMDDKENQSDDDSKNFEIPESPFVKSKGKRMRNSKEKQPTATPPPTSTSSNNSKKTEQLESQQLNAKSDALLSLLSTPMSDYKAKPIDFITLKHLSTEGILDSFDKYKSLLDRLYKQYKDFSQIKGHEGNNHYKVIDLIGNDVQLKMMQRLSERYEIHGAVTAKYGKLFAQVMMPEWLLCLFMEHMNLNREEALKRLEAQNTYQAQNTPLPFESDL